MTDKCGARGPTTPGHGPLLCDWNEDRDGPHPHHYHRDRRSGYDITWRPDLSFAPTASTPGGRPKKTR